MKSDKTITKISKWGNGYGIRLPIGTLEAYKLTEGSEVILSQEHDGVKVSPKNPSLADLSLAQILYGVTPLMLADKNPESLFGVPQGNEVW